MTKYKISTNTAAKAGYTVAKKAAKLAPSANEQFPLTQLNLGDSVYVPNRDARSLRGSIHSRKRVGTARFVSETQFTKNGAVKGVTVYRVK